MNPDDSKASAWGLSAWFDALAFAFTLSVLNVAYGIGGQIGVKPVTLLVWAMPSAAVMLLLLGGLGRDWMLVMAHPLSLVVGCGIIAMEAVYYVLLMFATPTDGSLLVRLGVPVAMLLGLVVRWRRPSHLSALGALAIVGVVVWYLPQMATDAPLTCLALGLGCALIMSVRAFATEFHPWNRRARTIREKMRITGLVLLVACLAGLALLLGALLAAANGAIGLPRWLPLAGDLLDPPAVALGLAVGLVVLTAMQYLGFSTVAKIGAENYIAATALIPLITLGVQEVAVSFGLLRPISIDWRVWPAMAGVMAGVALVVAGQQRRR